MYEARYTQSEVRLSRRGMSSITSSRTRPTRSDPNLMPAPRGNYPAAWLVWVKAKPFQSRLGPETSFGFYPGERDGTAPAESLRAHCGSHGSFLDAWSR